MIELSPQKWIKLLSKDHKPNDEEVILVPRLQKSGEIAIKKKQFEYYFGKSTGLQFKPGKEIEIICQKGESKKPYIPEWALNQLELHSSPKMSICITRRKDQFYLKAFETKELNTKIAGPIVFDRFSENMVTRSFSCISNPQYITDNYVDELLTIIGKFKYNPFANLHKIKGFIGFLTRRDIIGEISTDDIAFVNNYKKDILKSQESVDSHILLTASF